jgi:Secretion system C-terminal sorting domain
MKKNLYIFCFFLFFAFFVTNVTLFAQWETMEGPFAGSASLPVSSGGSLYVTSSTGIYKSDNDGESWYCILDKATAPDISGDLQILGNTMAVSQIYNIPSLSNLFGLQISWDAGQNWKYIPLPLMDSYRVNFLLMQDKVIYTASGLIWELSFLDFKWRPGKIGNLGDDYQIFKRYNNKIYGFSYSGKIAESSDEGVNWTNWTTTSFPVGQFASFWASGDTMYMTRHYPSTGNYSTYSTYNKGQVWSNIYALQSSISNVVRFQNLLFGQSYDRVVVSSDNGLNWDYLANSPKVEFGSLRSTPEGLFVLSGNNYSLYRIKNVSNLQWEQLSKGIIGGNITAFYNNDDMLLVGAEYGGVHKYDKVSEVWSERTIIPTFQNVTALGESNNTLICATKSRLVDSSFFFSEDNGLTWNASVVNGDFFNLGTATRICCIQEKCFAIRGEYSSVGSDWYSIDGGRSWNDTTIAGNQMTIYDGLFYSVVWNRKMLQVSNNGFNWFPLSSNGIDSTYKIIGFSPIGSTIYLVAKNSLINKIKLYYSDDSGFNWIFVGIIDVSIFSNIVEITGSTSIIYIEDDYKGLLYSIDKGVNWYALSPRDQGFSIPLGNDGAYLYYARGYYATSPLYRIPISKINYRQVKLIAYLDANANGQKDIGEATLPGVLVQQPYNGYTTTTDTLGSITLTMNIAPGGVDSIYVHQVESYHLIPTRSVIPVNAQDTTIYAAFIASNTSDLGVYLGQTKALYPGKPAETIVVGKNTGGQIFNGAAQIRLVLPTDLSGMETIPVPNIIEGDTAFWNLPILPPDSTFIIKIQFKAPQNLVWGDHFKFLAQIVTAQQDIAVSNNTAELDMYPIRKENQTWVFANTTSVDLKEVSTSSTGLVFCSSFQSYFSSSQFPINSVRFNAEIRKELNINTLKIIASSHPVKFASDYNGVITFRLNTPALPDSSQGDASRCFVLYSIEPSTKLKHGDLIGLHHTLRYNYGSGISSDQNGAIVRVWDKDVETDKEPEVAWNPISIFPNPTKGDFQIQTDDPDFANADLSILDVNGKICYQTRWQGGPIKVNLAAGTYWVRLTGKNKSGAGQLIVVD